MSRFVFSLLLFNLTFLSLFGKPDAVDGMITSAPPDVDLGPDQQICEGDVLTLDATVTDVGATYRWQDGSTAPTFSVTVTGTYSVTVTAGGESASDTVNVNVVDLPDLDLGNDTTLCLGDSLVFDLSHLGVEVLWPDGSRGDRYVVYNTTRVGVEIKTREGCSVSDVVQATFVAPPPVDLGNDIQTCEGLDVTLDATVAGNGILYFWNDGSTQPVRTVTQSGVYSVTATDRGCARSDTVQVTINDSPTVELGSADTSVCGSGPVVLQLENTTGTIVWSDGTTGPTNSITRSQQVWVRVTENGCTARDTINVQLVPLPPVDIGAAQQQICEGETAVFDATVSGSVSYLWQDGSTQPTFSTTQSGRYSVTVTDRGCTAEDAVDLTVNAVPVVDLGPADTLICEGAELILEISNTTGTITWPDGSSGTTYTVTNAGTIQVQVTNNNCTASDAINVNFGATPPVDLGPANQEICEGETATLDARVPSGATYLWEDGSTQPVRTVSQSGFYQVTVSSNGCPAVDDVQLTVNSLPAVDLGGTDTLVCDQQSLTFDLSAINGTFSWPDGSTGPTYTVTMSGMVQVVVSQNNCTATDAIQVDFGAVPDLDLGPSSISLCQDEPYVLQTQDPNATYIWSDGSNKNSLVVTESGTFWVVAENNGCTASDTISVDLTPVPKTNLGGAIDACEGNPVTLDAGNPGADIQWQDGTTGPLFTVQESGTYWVEIRKGACNVRDTVSINFKVTPEVEFETSDLSACAGETVTLEPFISMADRLQWQDGSVGFSLQTNTAGIYWLEAEVDGCTDRDSIRVFFQDPSAFDLGEDRAVCDNQVTILHAGTPSDVVRWSTGFSGTNLRVESPGTYWAVVDDGVCIASDTVQISFLPCGTDNIYVPSAFSPNQDDVNEGFRPFIHPSYEVTDYELSIFNRWGGLLFQTSNPDENWDGTYKGQQVQEGVYVYMIKIKFTDGAGEQDEVISGDVTIVR